MQHHEKIDSTETFVGNTREGEIGIQWLHDHGVKSARLGEAAYDSRGERIPDSWGYRPVFINLTDSANYDRAMMRKTFGRNAA